jgi:hypothetical protein
VADRLKETKASDAKIAEALKIAQTIANKTYKPEEALKRAQAL